MMLQLVDSNQYVVDLCFERCGIRVLKYSLTYLIFLKSCDTDKANVIIPF